MESLIEKAKDGDQIAFTELMLQIKDELYKVAKIRLKNDDAEKDFIDELRVRNGNLNISVGIMPENSVSALN